MTVFDRVLSAEVSASGSSLAETARGFLPRIRELARQMELAHRLDDDLVEDMDAAGLFSVVVPKTCLESGRRACVTDVTHVVDVIQL